ncbi:inactive polyglycylase TTLL10 [Grus japonensis]|uniref:Inactive polyglycylase TTLL10 n=1 Tax=Grus japonensis TaxID=30415 RepID=A0ABC9XP67_GRUJA
MRYKGGLASGLAFMGSSCVLAGGRQTANEASGATSTNSEVELDKAKSNENRTHSKACPQEKQPEEEILKVPMGAGPYFYISGSNGAGLVSIYCQNRGWQRIYDNRREDYALKWCEIKCQETYYHFKEGEQLLYQIPNNRVLTSKIGLLSCLREQERVMKKIGRSSNSKYIHQPLLLEGKKFDVRSYLLIACTAPNVLFFAQGYVRLTCVNYDAASDDLTFHLTNQHMQKKNSLYSQLKDETVWRMEHFNSYVNEKFRKTSGLPKDWVFTVFTKRMQQIMLQCFLAAKHKLDRKLGYFDLIGCDFLIDENFKVWLLEMNANPALHTDCKVLKDVIPTVVYESLDLVLEIFNKRLKGQSVLPLKTLCHFVLLYHEDAADLGQKQPWKLRTGRFLQPQPGSIGHFGQSPAKVRENSAKKLSCSRKKVALLSRKNRQQTTLTIPHVQLFDRHGKTL